MSKAILWVVTGLALGLLVAFVIRPSVTENQATGMEVATIPDASVTAPSIRDFQQLAIRVGELETKIDQLVGNLDDIGGQRATSEQLGTAQSTPEAAPVEQSQRFVERLVAGGFTPDRAEWIGRRSEELLLAQIEARYAAEREGVPLGMEALERLGPQYMLREELGDWEYERYLEAQGRPTSVGVENVLENSPAARAGLASGDQIVSYGGTRVFNVFEVTQLTREGTVGETVVVDIVRGGQPMQIVIPRGPLGAALSGNGLPGAVILPSNQNQ